MARGTDECVLKQMQQFHDGGEERDPTEKESNKPWSLRATCHRSRKQRKQGQSPDCSLSKDVLPGLCAAVTFLFFFF